jgi:hypothetical protein
MTESPLRSIGGEPLPEGVDLAGLALRAMALGASLGSALECVVLWGTRMITAQQPPSDTPVLGAAFFLVVFGTLASMGVGAVTVWHLLRPIPSAWRRTGLSAIAGFATLVAAAVAVPIDVTFGPTALLGAAALFGAVAFRSAALVRRWGTESA